MSEHWPPAWSQDRSGPCLTPSWMVPTIEPGGLYPAGSNAGKYGSWFGFSSAHSPRPGNKIWTLSPSDCKRRAHVISLLNKALLSVWQTLNLTETRIVHEIFNTFYLKGHSVAADPPWNGYSLQHCWSSSLTSCCWKTPSSSSPDRHATHPDEKGAGVDGKETREG